ncbi:hypothetical protein BUALT_Bualt03G0017100 [Buddleja alternifolia]|uniref:Uncharacterized protein n=1 Tax=Buddleja alternifolia TaxID=168488 RepID=A0AAV6Y1Q4_9LAMI|nr:hypothetical protein BUALT_Bualt03G0017100 [Buddleja alternifolia]
MNFEVSKGRSMSSVDHHEDYYLHSQPRRGFLTPPPTWRTNRCSPVMPGSEKKPRKSPQQQLFHVIHKVPSGDSPYVRAKHVQLIDKDPTRSISLFWAAINSGDRVDSALKDMAVVMKQLDRSDEAIEAVKSFRHLCPPESQESLDNILVELYKQSGRIEEEIEMLQMKVKQVEEGMAFGGKRTKMARSQGKKIHITVEKEYSRLLGNLAWAYMQHNDFKSAEENYRKALSFESDKNKQCNLAVCLMQMNKLTEAKFLLQTIKFSSDNGRIDESHVKSFERASEMLAELESQRVLNLMKQTEHNNEPRIARGFVDVNKMNKGAFTEFPYEKRSDFGWSKNHYQLNMGQKAYSARKRTYESPLCNRSIPKVPFTQPRRCSQSSNNAENAYGGYCRKLSFEPYTDSENGQPLVDRNVNHYSTASNTNLGKDCLYAAGDWRENSLDSLDGGKIETIQLLECNEQIFDRDSDQICKFTAEVNMGPSDVENVNPEAGWRTTCEKSTRGHKTSWADMAEEDEQEKESWRSDLTCKFAIGSMNNEGFSDENVDSNIISETPNSLNEAEKLSDKIETINLGEGYFTQPGKISNLSVRRSLCFDQNHKSGTVCSALSDAFSPIKSIKRRNRLQVFQDITHVPGSPKPC